MMRKTMKGVGVVALAGVLSIVLAAPALAQQDGQQQAQFQPVGVTGHSWGAFVTPGAKVEDWLERAKALCDGEDLCQVNVFEGPELVTHENPVPEANRAGLKWVFVYRHDEDPQVKVEEVGAGGGDETKISERERRQLLELMAESRSQYLGLLAKTSDAQWSWKPQPDRWSVGECAEHILRSNEALFSWAQQALAGEVNPDWKEKTRGKAELLLQVMPNRAPFGQPGPRATAPLEIRPTGEFSRQAIVERFSALYDQIEQFIRETDAPLKSHTEEHPFPIFNTLSAYDWVLYVPLHTIRHSRQMIEVMETEGYPAQ